MSDPTINIDQALRDVRKAYRLLHGYQRMAMDAVAYIGQQLDIRYYGGWPKFSKSSPGRGRGALNFWAWDWLNMLYYEFHFVKELDNDTELKVSMLLISDTGCFNSGAGEPDSADFFPLEQSSTKIGFLISAKGWPCDFLEDYKAMKTFVENDGQIPSSAKAQGAIGKCFDFSCLVSEKSTNGLIDELVALATKHGIPLKRISPQD